MLVLSDFIFSSKMLAFITSASASSVKKRCPANGFFLVITVYIKKRISSGLALSRLWGIVKCGE